MNLHHDLLNIITVALLCWILFAWLSHQTTVLEKHRRQLRPRSPHDCALCCQGSPPPENECDITPWAECKSRRGRPKTMNTDEQYCDNRQCAFYLIKDSQCHALVGDGKRGKREPIQWFRCQACGNRFSERRHTPMRALKTPRQRVTEIIKALGEGVDLAAASRIFSHHLSTIARWRDRFAHLDHVLHHRFFSDYPAEYVQLDELKVKARHSDSETWVWSAYGSWTGLLPFLSSPSKSRR